MKDFMAKGIAFKLFGSLTKPYLDYFETLNRNLKRAMMKVSLHEYLCSILLISFIALLASMILGSVFISFLFPFEPTIFYTYTLSIIISFIIAGLVFFMGYYYPSLKSKSIETQVNRSLPFAVFYMSTSASSGILPTEIFRLLSLRGGIIGEEAGKIYKNTTSLGMSLNDSIQRIAESTPSSHLADLLYGMSSTITTGGDLGRYLSGKAKSFMNFYRRSLNDYSKMITFYTEIYITLMVVGSLLFIVLLAVMSPIGGSGAGRTSTLFLQTFLVFIFTPLVSVGFIILLKSISPSE
jgi:archaellum biogenesis protein FlaJ (TadC family)